MKGKHAFRFGFEFMRQNYDQVGNQFARGQFTFQPNATQSPTFTGGDTFADFLLGTMYQSEAAVQMATLISCGTAMLPGSTTPGR